MDTTINPYENSGTPDVNPQAAPVIEPKNTSTILIILFLVIFFPAAIYLLWKKDNWSIINKLIAALLITVVGLFEFLVVFGIVSASLSPKTPAVLPQPTESPIASPLYNYIILNKESKPGGTSMAGTPVEPFENFDILISPTDAPNGETISKDVLKNHCTVKCNISIWNDKRAMELELTNQHDLTTSNWTKEQFEAWEKQNYVYIADHLVGYIYFSDQSFYDSYPYKDWRYDELKSNVN